MTCQTTPNYFPDIIKGDTFTGLSMTFYNGVGEDKTPMDLTDASVLIQFKKGAGQSVVFKFDTADNTILIPDPESGQILLGARVMNYPAYNYIFDVQVTTASGTVHTYFSSHWRVLQDV